MPDKSRRQARVAAALANAPIDDDPVTPSERRAVARAKREVKRGEVVTHAELERRFGVGRPKTRPSAVRSVTVRLSASEDAQLTSLEARWRLSGSDALRRALAIAVAAETGSK